MASKPAEEGWFWEWRTFGEPPDSVVRVVEAHEVRGEAGVEGEDLYLVAAATDQNVKLRDETLKLKPLLVRLDGGFELYEEARRLVFAFPLDAEAVRMAASLLGLVPAAEEAEDAAALVDALGREVRRVAVRKRRTQYAIGDGWAEIADLEFPAGRVRSLGIQSSSLGETRRIRALLDPKGALEPTNYVEACRIWGG
jgi:hypothetical protein